MFAAAAGFPPTTVTVRTLSGAGSGGQVFAGPVDRRVFLADRREMVKDRAGTDVVSDSCAYGDPELADLFTPGSEVDLPGRTATVIKTARNVIGDPDVDHCRVWLT